MARKPAVEPWGIMDYESEVDLDRSPANKIYLEDFPVEQQKELNSEKTQSELLQQGAESKDSQVFSFALLATLTFVMFTPFFMWNIALNYYSESDEEFSDNVVNLDDHRPSDDDIKKAS